TDELRSPEVREKINRAQMRKPHGLGFPSRAEIGFAEVVEVSEVVDYDAVAVKLHVRRLSHYGCQSRVLDGGIVSSQAVTSAIAPTTVTSSRPTRSQEHERCDRAQPESTR